MWGFIGKKCEDCGGRHLFYDTHIQSCAARSARLSKELEEIMKKEISKRRLIVPNTMTPSPFSAMSISTPLTSDIARRKKEEAAEEERRRRRRRDEDDQRRRDDDDDDHRSSFSFGSSSGGDSDFGGSSSGFGGGDSGGGGSSSDF
jgi:uncharacterized membrane protein YgcG